MSAFFIFVHMQKFLFICFFYSCFSVKAQDSLPQIILLDEVHISITDTGFTVSDFIDIVKILKNESGIKKVVMTTNGYHLDQKAKNIVDSGLNGINISIDSLN